MAFVIEVVAEGQVFFPPGSSAFPCQCLTFIHLARQRRQMTQRHITEDTILHSHLYGNVKLLLSLL